jgi:hypothetical protein
MRSLHLRYWFPFVAEGVLLGISSGIDINSLEGTLPTELGLLTAMTHT